MSEKLCPEAIAFAEYMQAVALSAREAVVQSPGQHLLENHLLFGSILVTGLCLFAVSAFVIAYNKDFYILLIHNYLDPYNCCFMYNYMLLYNCCT